MHFGMFFKNAPRLALSTNGTVMLCTMVSGHGGKKGYKREMLLKISQTKVSNFFVVFSLCTLQMNYVQPVLLL